MPGWPTCSSATTEDVSFKAKDGNEAHGLLVKPAGYVAGQKYPTAAPHPRRPERARPARLQLRARALRRERLRRAQRELSRQQRPRREIPAGDLRRLGQQGSRRSARPVSTTSSRCGIADPDRLGIGGWSYGGILTDYTIATTNRFKAAIVRRRQRASALDVRLRSIHLSVRATSSARRGRRRISGSRSRIRSSTLTASRRRRCSWAATRISMSRRSAASRCTRRSAASTCRRSWSSTRISITACRCRASTTIACSGIWPGTTST